MQSVFDPPEDLFVHEYKSLVSWNYRPPAMPVLTPALVRHLGFWIAGAAVDVGSDERRKLFRELANAIADRNAARGFKLENPPQEDTDPDRRFLTLRIDSGTWRAMPVKLVVELHNEFLTVSAQLELKFDKNEVVDYRGIRDRKLLELTARGAGGEGETHPDALEKAQGTSDQEVGLPTLRQAIYAIEALVANRVNELDPERLPEPGPDRQRCEALRGVFAAPYQEIFTKVWDQFDREILEGAARDVWDRDLSELRKEDTEKGGRGESKQGTAKSSDLGKVFADFRGFLLPYRRLANTMRALSDDDATQPPTSRHQDPSKEESVEMVGKGVALARSILPLMTPEPEKKGRKELTVSLFLDGRCLYASTLGAQPPLPEEVKQENQPLTYLLMPVSLNSWQMGRLVDRLHRLGVVRLASCRHLAELRGARHRLKKLEDEILRPELLGLRRHPGTEDGRDHGPQMGDDDAQQVARKLHNAAVELASIKRSVPGGLAYRIERTRYYRNQFVSIIKPLRIDHGSRIEGFQPYHEFVYSRFGDTFEFIDMLGKRLDRVDQQLTAKNEEFRTLEMDKVRKATHELTKSMTGLVFQLTRLQTTSKNLLGTSTDLLNTSNTLQFAIADLQLVGEYALFLVIAPYYVSQMLFHLVSPLAAAMNPKELQLITTAGAMAGGYCAGQMLSQIVSSLTTAANREWLQLVTTAGAIAAGYCGLVLQKRRRNRIEAEQRANAASRVASLGIESAKDKH